MILLTGASGFIGKHLLKAIAQVHGKDCVVALTSTPINGYRYLLHDNYNFDNKFFENSVYRSIHTIIHAGAFTPKKGKDANNIEGCNSNILNTWKLINIDFPQLRKFIFLSTLDVYGSSEIISEKSTIEPFSLYGHSKYYCERMIEAKGIEKSIVTQVLRVGHVYGPGEEAYHKIIPLTFKRLINNKPLEIWGTGEEKRSFIYIDDVVKAILEAIRLEKSIEQVNLVGAQVVSVRQLLNLMIKITGAQPLIETVPATSKGRDLVFDNGKMKKYLLDSETPLQIGLSEEWKYMQKLYI